MKNLLFFIFLFLFFKTVKSQQFKTSAFVSANASFGYSKVKNSLYNKFEIDPPGIGFSAALKEEYYFQKPFSISCELMYSYVKASLRSPDSLGSLAIFTLYLQHTLFLHQLEVPFLLKWRGKKEDHNFYLFAGAGISYIFSGSKKVERIQYKYTSPKDKTITPVSNGAFSFQNKNPVGSFMIIGLGKNFIIKENKFFAEFRYRQDLSRWLYPAPYYRSNELPVQIHSFSLSLGYTF